MGLQPQDKQLHCMCRHCQHQLVHWRCDHISDVANLRRQRHCPWRFQPPQIWQTFGRRLCSLPGIRRPEMVLLERRLRRVGVRGVQLYGAGRCPSLPRQALPHNDEAPRCGVAHGKAPRKGRRLPSRTRGLQQLHCGALPEGELEDAAPAGGRDVVAVRVQARVLEAVRSPVGPRQVGRVRPAELDPEALRPRHGHVVAPEVAPALVDDGPLAVRGGVTGVDPLVERVLSKVRAAARNAPNITTAIQLRNKVDAVTKPHWVADVDGNRAPFLTILLYLCRQTQPLERGILFRLQPHGAKAATLVALPEPGVAVAGGTANEDSAVRTERQLLSIHSTKRKWPHGSFSYGNFEQNRVAEWWLWSADVKQRIICTPGHRHSPICTQSRKALQWLSLVDPADKDFLNTKAPAGECNPLPIMRKHRP
mmetsp:Transcript_82337/g.233255  ORF Transcript_82337/g.233255 Transcript_82337/m.233255 type:complete len:422 (+) Transcript_82337:2300-3565(+)